MFRTFAAWLAAITPALASALADGVPALGSKAGSAPVHTTTCKGKSYCYQELAGYGFVPSDARDKYGDTVGAIGSAIALDAASWTKNSDGSYSGALWCMPDRGWNTQGTINYVPRLHKFDIAFTPKPQASVADPSPPNLQLTHSDTILLTGPDGQLATGLDADGSGHLTYPGFPKLPVATYVGDGFGGPGPGGKSIPIDAEGLVMNRDGSFWISDEYGPYIYHFDSSGVMTAAIRPPEAIIPKRNGSDSFSSNSPRFGSNGQGDDVIPANNPTGRNNNHGFEGLSASADGKTLWVMLQAADNQEGGLNKKTERYTRLLKYDVSNKRAPRYVAEYVVPLPRYSDPSGGSKVAAQSEIMALPNGQFFVLARDSGAGGGQPKTLSAYRHIDVFDIAGATNIKGGTFDCAKCAVASRTGVLDPRIRPATVCSFLDFNINSQLGRFGLRNGGIEDIPLLNEKWESIALAPVDPQGGNKDNEYFIFSLSDNDFRTLNGFMNFGQNTYSDVVNLNSQALVFKAKLPF